MWEPGPDQLCIGIQKVVDGEGWTKRRVFSSIAQLYDPLGLIAPVIAWAKICMQRLWLATLDWDELIPKEAETNWNRFYKELPLLNAFKLPRYVFVDKPLTLQFHMFCDASEAGYGACMYARSIGKDGNIVTELLASKSRVAPLKRLSLPRLELCAALLGAKLYARVAAALRMEGVPCRFWSDSFVTLHWISSPPNTWQTFVGNRTAEIQQLTHGHLWNHVRGKDYPADYVSRGMLPNELLSQRAWRHGPSWLAESEEKWDQRKNLPVPDESSLERRTTTAVLQKNAPTACFLFERYSSFDRLVRVTSYVLRFVNCCRSKRSGEYGTFLSVKELKETTERLVKLAQHDSFNGELKALKAGSAVGAKSTVKLLNPFVDNNGILRVGGRLRESDEQYPTKHPMLLPKMHPLSRLIALHYHLRTFHSGPRMTLASIRQKYWPVCGKALTTHVCRKCLSCFRHNPAPANQPVGQLPKHRIVPSRPFAYTGVDYCGPVFLKPTHRRAASRKAFIAVFICFSTKAIHLELVGDLSTEAFIAALRRFVARRGVPVEIHSDNATNFRGARNVLAELYAILNDTDKQQKIVNECTRSGIQWIFIPPRAPNFGGLWEAAVKSVKQSLIKTIGNTQLGHDDFLTLLAQVEATLNSRPLTPLSEDPSEMQALTPGHFLVGSPLTTLPDPDYTTVPMNRLKHYQLIQKLAQEHWERWKKEYLTQLHQQSRKSSTPVEFQVGQMVLMHEEAKPSITWPLARIIATHCGKDGIVRVATVKTSCGIYKRPTIKLFPLPNDEQASGLMQEDQRDDLRT